MSLEQMSSAMACLLILILTCATGCSGTDDVTANKRYWVGWVPGQTYQLKMRRDLARVDPDSTYYFDTCASGEAIGTFVGCAAQGMNPPTITETAMVVWNGSIGTRFRVEKLVRHWHLFSSPDDPNVTHAQARLLDGPFAGTTVRMLGLSRNGLVAGDEYIDVPLPWLTEPAALAGK